MLLYLIEQINEEVKWKVSFQREASLTSSLNYETVLSVVEAKALTDRKSDDTLNRTQRLFSRNLFTEFAIIIFII